MFQVTKIQIRPNANVPFFHEVGRTDEYKEYFKTNFKDTLKNVSMTRTVSEDSLTLTSVTLWSSSEAFQEFILDSYCYEHYVLAGQIYDLENGITSQNHTETI
jgi:hypothetical protein